MRRDQKKEEVTEQVVTDKIENKEKVTIDADKKDNAEAKNFSLGDCPHLYEYLVNEFHRFCGEDQVGLIGNGAHSYRHWIT